ncbi:MAG: hypothetical protein O2779_04450 [Nanoarchaeota archaeon]|nr:hypothetical protein [Nanoarchaeota archaeon]
MTETPQKPTIDKHTVRGDVDGLLLQLKKAFQEKEEWFAKKEALKKTIHEQAASLKTLRSERDSFNSSIKQAKVKRKEAHKAVKEDLTVLEQLKQEQETFSKKQHIVGSPGMLRKRIEQLEIRVETECMSFDKEKTLMKEINRLRKQRFAAASARALSSHTREATWEMYTSKRQADKLHRSIQTTAKQSQQRHVKLISSFKELRKLEKQQEAAFKKFVLGKRKCQELQKEISKSQAVLRKVRKGEQNKKKQSQSLKQSRNHSLLAEKAKAVEAKFKSKGKLTTEDLLVLQGFNK